MYYINVTSSYGSQGNTYVGKSYTNVTHYEDNFKNDCRLKSHPYCLTEQWPKNEKEMKTFKNHEKSIFPSSYLILRHIIQKYYSRTKIRVPFTLPLITENCFSLSDSKVKFRFLEIFVHNLAIMWNQLQLLLMF